MSERAKLINLLIKYGQELEKNVNKKYRPFIRSITDVHNLTKSINHEEVCLGKEFIVFKLGLEAKSTKAIEISLTYLHKLFCLKMVNLNAPNYCEHYRIEENEVKQIEMAASEKQMRHEIVRLIEPLIHFKSAEIASLMAKIMEFLISEPVLPILLELSLLHPGEILQNALFNYFSFRFYVFEDIYTYSEAQMNSFDHLVLRNQRINKEIIKATQEHQRLIDLIARYMNEYLTIICGGGGRYGTCVMCNQPADHYCKITRAGLCSMECKKKHIDIAERQYRSYFQAVNLFNTIEEGFGLLLKHLETHQAPMVLNVLANLLEKPHLFMIAKPQFRRLLSKHVNGILYRTIAYKHGYDPIYSIMASLSKHWLEETISTVELFFRDIVIPTLQDKRPTFKLLSSVFRSLSRMFEHGQTLIQLYINLDCELNKENLIEKVMFEVARITQDRITHFAKQEKTFVKNWCMSFYMSMSQGLNSYRKTHPDEISIDSLLELKQRKICLEKFTLKFNEHWSNGLKALFNLNLVGLDSNQEIVEIITSVKGLDKSNIDQLIFGQSGEAYRGIFLNRIARQTPLLGLIELLRFVPVKMGSLAVKMFLQHFKEKQAKYTNGQQAECTKGQISQRPVANLEQYLSEWVQFLIHPFKLEQFKDRFSLEGSYSQIAIHDMFYSALDSTSAQTTSPNRSYFTYCTSASYLEVLSSQLSLLQIPISYLLETAFDSQKILSLCSQLVQICRHSNWVSLVIKNCGLHELDEDRVRHVSSILKLIRKNAAFIQDWTTILTFFCDIQCLLHRDVPASKAALSDAVSMSDLEDTMLEIGEKACSNFNKYVLGVLFAAKEQMLKNRVFMLQKYFEILSGNLKKSLDCFPLVYAEMVKMCHLPLVLEVHMELADRVKQFMAKMLKMPHHSQSCHSLIGTLPMPNLQATPNIQTAMMSLMIELCVGSKDICDFVINCVSMTVLHHYDLTLPTWKLIFQMMTTKAEEYSLQVLIILDKVIERKLDHCEPFTEQLLHLCLLITRNPSSEEAIHSLHSLEFIIQILINKDTQDIYAIIKGTVQRLISSLPSICTPLEAVEVILTLLEMKQEGEEIVSSADLNGCIVGCFQQVLAGPLRGEVNSRELIISYITKRSIAMQNHSILKDLQVLLTGSPTPLSFTALNCIKMYIQAHPQQSTIMPTLLTVLRHTDVTSIDCQLPVLIHAMKVQKIVIDLLPNDPQALDDLLAVYQHTINFNDNLPRRVALGQKGLCSEQKKKDPPELLRIEEAIANRLLAIYIIQGDDGLYHFSLGVFKRYIEAAETMPTSSLHKNYLSKRIIPLFKIIIYLLPKLPKLCHERQRKLEFVPYIISTTAHVEEREPFIRVMREIAAR